MLVEVFREWIENSLTSVAKFSTLDVSIGPGYPCPRRVNTCSKSPMKTSEQLEAYWRPYYTSVIEFLRK